jgi:hypothetical protein
MAASVPVQAGTWTACPSSTINGGPAFGIWPMSDGSVLSHGNALNVWVKLTPSTTGGYAGGTWTTLANSPWALGGAEEHLLNDGRLMETGAEYVYSWPSGSSSTDYNDVQIYDPVANTWTIGPKGLYGDIGDSATAILADGRWFGSSRTTMATEIYTPSTNTWTAAASKTDNTGDEEAWAPLTNGKIFALSNTSHDIYDPSANTWTQTAAPPSAFVPGDVGPVVPLYDGRILCLGYESSAVYTPSSNTWQMLPAYPALASDEDGEDSYGTIMPNGHVMFELYSIANGPNGIGDFNPSTNTYSTIAFPSGASGGPFSMAPLPNGQVMVTFGNLDYLYTPDGSPSSSWRPTVTSVALKSGTTYTLTGTQLTGLVLGGTEGDDMENWANFPVVYLTSGSNTYYCKTTNPSTRFPQSGGTQTVTFTLPSGLANGTYNLYVATCGVSSSAYSFTVGSTSLPSPTAFWKFDEGTGTSASDSSGNGHTGTLTGGAGWTSSSKVGPYALSLNGSGEYSQASGAVVNTSQSFTAACWVKLNSTSSYETFMSIDGTTVSAFYLQYNAGNGRISFNRLASDSDSAASTVAEASAAPSTGTWYHVVGVYDASAKTIALYVNGALQQSVSFTSAWQGTGSTEVGRGKFSGNPTDFVNGTIDNARIYNTALTAAQVSSLYSSGG